MARRMRRGQRVHRVRIQRYIGPEDAYGQPEYHDDANWEDFVSGWMAEVVGARGGEVVRGRQTSDFESYVLYGDWAPVRLVNARMRAIIPAGCGDGYETVGLLDVSDPYGDRRTMVMEARRER